MKAFLVIKILLLPLAFLFGAAGVGRIEYGLVGGTALAGALTFWRWRKGEVSQLELAVLAIFVLALGAQTAHGLDIPQLLILAYGVLSAMSFLSLARGKPWTAEFSKGDFAAQAGTPAFLAINRTISLLWGVLFAALALAKGLGLPQVFTAVIIVTGVTLSIAGPRLLVRRALKAMLKREPYSWPMPAIGATKADCDVAVIGAGLGGLTAAALLARAGAKVRVVDQHVLPGGYCHHWPRRANADGRKLIFRFDSGVHDFSGVHAGGAINGIMNRLDAPAIDWLPLSHRYILNDITLDIPHGADAYVARLGALFPLQAAGLAALFADIRAILESMCSEAPRYSGVPGAPRSIEGLMAFPARYPLSVQWMDRPFIELLRHHINDPALEALLFALGGYISDTPLEAPVRRMAPIFGYAFHGGGYPRGGSGVPSQALVEVIERHGGSVRLGTRVEKILMEAGRASGLLLPKGEMLRAGAVISNADFKATMLSLVGRDHLPETYVRRLEALRPACSAMMVHLGLRGSLEIPPVIHVQREGASVGMVSPSAADPSAAPEGCSTLELMHLIPNREAKAWFENAGADLKRHRRSPEYHARKAAAGDRMIVAARHAVPDLDQRVIFRTEASPLTFHRYDLAADGSIYGIEGFVGEPLKSPVPGLVIAGSATLGPGAEAAMIAGARAAELFVPGLLDTRTTLDGQRLGTTLAEYGS